MWHVNVSLMETNVLFDLIFDALHFSQLLIVVVVVIVIIVEDICLFLRTNDVTMVHCYLFKEMRHLDTSLEAKANQVKALPRYDRN